MGARLIPNYAKFTATGARVLSLLTLNDESIYALYKDMLNSIDSKNRIIADKLLAEITQEPQAIKT